MGNANKKGDLSAEGGEAQVDKSGPQPKLSRDTWTEREIKKTASELEEDKPSSKEWTAYADDNTGEIYFTNTLKRVTTWTKPKGTIGVGEGENINLDDIESIDENDNDENQMINIYKCDKDLYKLLENIDTFWISQTML